jgi:hypothetical protein
MVARYSELMIGLRRMEELQAEAHYHRDRYRLYKAKTLGPHLTSAARLADLERRCQGADSRLRAAERENARPVGAVEDSL